MISVFIRPQRFKIFFIIIAQVINQFVTSSLLINVSNSQKQFLDISENSTIHAEIYSYIFIRFCSYLLGIE